MADIRKDQERDELHRAIWAIADGLRGSVDGWDFKSYVLGMMFYRYISDNLNMTLETIFKNIEDSAKGSESEDNFVGLFDDIDVNSNKLGATVAKRNANLEKLIEGVADMKLGNYKENSIVN